MSAFPIADAVEAAATATDLAATEETAAARAGGPVFLAIEPLPATFASLAAAEAAYPALYADGRFEAAFLEGAWRVLVRFWRRAPAAPVGADVLAAWKKPLGRAGTPEEARALLDAPAERASDLLPQWRRSATAARALAHALVEQGLADLVEREGRFTLRLTYWRPIALRDEAERQAELRRALAVRLARPLRPEKPQLGASFGLFERPAPENPEIVLTEEEGSGRKGEE